MAFPSPSPLPEGERTKVAALLQPVALALVAMAGIARKAHWNVRGPMFAELHGLFGELYTATSDHADTIAEHMARLGYPVNGDHVDVAEATPITRMPATLTSGRDLAKAVADRLTAALVIVNQAQKRTARPRRRRCAAEDSRHVDGAVQARLDAFGARVMSGRIPKHGRRWWHWFGFFGVFREIRKM